MEKEREKKGYAGIRDFLDHLADVSPRREGKTVGLGRGRVKEYDFKKPKGRLQGLLGW